MMNTIAPTVVLTQDQIDSYHREGYLVLAKGMPTWGPVLGPKKISEVTAYVLSKHKEGEPIVIEPTAVASQ